MVRKQKLFALPSPEGPAVRRNSLIRRSIVEASAKAFASRGYAATTMEEVAREAGFSPSSLYGYFKSKEALYLALLDYLSEQVFDVFEDPLLRDLAFFERVSWVLRRMLRMVEQTPEFFEIFFQGQRADSKNDAPIFQEKLRIERALVLAFAEQLRFGQREGSLVECDAEELAYVLTGAFRGWMGRWLHGEMPEGLQESFSRFLTLVRPMLEPR